MLALLPLVGGSGLLIAPVAPVVRPSGVRFTPVCMQQDQGLSEWEKYQMQRGQASFEEAQGEYKTFKTLSLEDEFDGGDSGAGAVGDGNVDLEDQHNSATLGALRGGIADVGSAGMSVGRGNVQTLNDEYGSLPDEQASVQGVTNARQSSAGKNYFGRSTGLADKLIDGITEDDLKTGRMDKVRAQQKENWFNQRAIHAQNRAQGQGVVFGQNTGIQPREGGFIAREAMAAGQATPDGEISQRDLATHLDRLASLPAERLDGEEWGALQLTADDVVEATVELRVSPRQTTTKDIPIQNLYNTFAPFRCAFLPGSDPSFSCTPNHGSMNRRSGEPTTVTVRYSPMQSGVVVEGWLVFETEDFRKVYRFLGST